MKLTRELSRKILMDVNEGQRFYCHNGKFFFSLNDLKNDLKIMSDEVFLYHTSNGHNDFSNWIRDCFGDIKLAKEIINLNKQDTLKKIKARIVYVEKYLEKNI